MLQGCGLPAPAGVLCTMPLPTRDARACRLPHSPFVSPSPPDPSSPPIPPPQHILAFQIRPVDDDADDSSDDEDEEEAADAWEQKFD